ncbi:MAG: hypothetical protein ACRD20_06460 [Terriglobales bacterium]
MDTYRLKIKIGEHEFEAEGQQEAVQSQFKAFKELIASLPAPQVHIPTTAVAQTPTALSTVGGEAPNLDKIMRIEGRVISLTARPSALDDVLLLLLLGQRQYRSNDSVTGSEVVDGLEQSGVRVGRVDRNLERLATQGDVIKIGTGRASRYRLTNQGMAKAQAIVRDLLATLP